MFFVFLVSTKSQNKQSSIRNVSWWSAGTLQREPPESLKGQRCKVLKLTTLTHSRLSDCCSHSTVISTVVHGLQPFMLELHIFVNNLLTCLHSQQQRKMKWNEAKIKLQVFDKDLKEGKINELFFNDLKVGQQAKLTTSLCLLEWV